MTSRRWLREYFYVKQRFHSSQFLKIASDRTLPITSSRRCSPSTRTRSWWRWWRLTSESRNSRIRYTMLPCPGSGQPRTTTRSILRRAAREPRRGAWTPSSATARRSPGWRSTTLILIFYHLPAPPSSGSSGPPHLACTDTFNIFQHLVKPIVHSILLFIVSILMWFYLSWHFTMWCQVYDDYLLQYKLIIHDDKDDIDEWDVGRLDTAWMAATCVKVASSCYRLSAPCPQLRTLLACSQFRTPHSSPDLPQLRLGGRPHETLVR